MFSVLREYYYGRSIRGKINITVITAAGIILVAIMALVTFRTRSIIMKDGEAIVTSFGKENAYKAVNFINAKQSSLTTLAETFEASLSGTGQISEFHKDLLAHLSKVDKDIFAVWYIGDAAGGDSSSVNRYMYSSQSSAETESLLQRVEREMGYQQIRQLGETWINDPVKIGDRWLASIGVPIIDDKKGTVVGAVGYLIENSFFEKLVNEITKDGESACKIVTGNGIVAAHYEAKKIGTLTDEGDATEQTIQKIKANEFFVNKAHSSTFDGTALKVFVPIPFAGTKYTWSFCTMVPISVLLKDAQLLFLFSLLMIVIALVVLVVVTNTISRRLSAPIVEASNELKIISEGRLSEARQIEVHSKDEIGSMIEGLNEMSSSLKHLAYFAHEVGQGNLDAAIQERSEHDAIGKAMVEMKQNLVAAREAEVERKRTDEIQSWKVEGNARIHETIRKESASIKQLCDAFLHEVITYSKSIQGGLFIINDDQESEKHIELVSCVAYDRKKMLSKRMELDEGMVGRCIYEKAPVILTEIPQDYLSITSGLGDRRPDFLAIVPLINNEIVVGAIEIASFEVMPQHVLEYLDKAAESLASAIANVKINERTQRLLDQTKMFAEEMAAQEEELRQNMEEMQAAQEEMHRKTQEYEETIQALRVQVGEMS